MDNSTPPIHILDSIAEGCQVVDRNYRYLYLNEAAARHGRRNRSELLGLTMMEAYPGIEATPMFALLRECLEQGTTHRLENEFTYPEGGKAWFQLIFEPVPDGVFILSQDITEQRHGESERRRLSTAISHSAEAVVITDASGDIVYVNSAFEQVTGYTREEVMGANPRILKSGKQGAEFYAEMWGVLKAGRTWKGRLVNRRKNGQLFTEEATISPVFDSGGAITNYVCVKRDITRELSLEEQFRQSQKMEAIGQLAGGVAHDFNNLLSLIIGYSDVLLEGLRGDDPIHQDIMEIRRAGERAAHLTRQLLAFSRKQPLQPASLNLNAVVDGMREMLQRLLGTHIRMHVQLDPALDNILADRSQMEQVIMNLAVNARDAMPDGGRLSITTQNIYLDQDYASSHYAVASGPHVMLAVSDNGIGMDEETRERIFEPFFTTKGSDRGTGLGLSTVYGIVKQSGGSVWVYSEPGEGSTFKVYLPRELSGARRITPAAELERHTPTGEVILLVEDEEGVRNLTRRLLNSAGYVVIAAANGIEALEEFEKRRGGFDLVVTDIVMPRMGGVELSARLRQIDPGIRILFMSGYAENAIDHFEQMPVGQHFVGKPFSASELTSTVRRVLRSGGGVAPPK